MVTVSTTREAKLIITVIGGIREPTEEWKMTEQVKISGQQTLVDQYQEPKDAAVHTDGIYQNNSASNYRDTCSSMFIAAPVTAAKKWKMKMWHMYTMEFYSSVTKNRIVITAGKWNWKVFC